MVKTTDQRNTAVLSIAAILGQRSEAFAQIRFYADRLAQLGNAVEQLDAALMTVQNDNSNSEQQALVDAGRNLVAVLAEPAANFQRMIGRAN